MYIQRYIHEEIYREKCTIIHIHTHTKIERYIQRYIYEEIYREKCTIMHNMIVHTHTKIERYIQRYCNKEVGIHNIMCTYSEDMS